MPRHVDALTAPTLKHLRDRWWDNDFSEFLRETLRPRPGTRILDVGCGDGTAEVMLGRLHISQVTLFAVDRELDQAKGTAQAGSAHNIRLYVAAADALCLPFGDGGVRFHVLRGCVAARPRPAMRRCASWPASPSPAAASSPWSQTTRRDTGSARSTRAERRSTSRRGSSPPCWARTARAAIHRSARSCRRFSPRTASSCCR